jgi:hypothetical protein
LKIAKISRKKLREKKNSNQKIICLPTWQFFSLTFFPPTFF